MTANWIPIILVLGMWATLIWAAVHFFFEGRRTNDRQDYVLASIYAIGAVAGPVTFAVLLLTVH